MLGVSRAVLLSALPFAREAYASTLLSLDPVAYWQLGEAGGTTIVDEKGLHEGTYRGTPQGTIEFGLEPIVQNSLGTSVGFDGTSTYGEIQHDLAFAVPAATIVFAVQADSVSGQHLLVAKDRTGVAGGFTVDIKDGRLRAYVRNAGGSAEWLPSTAGAADISVGQAYHVALTCGSRGAELWLDGALVASNPGLTTGLGGNAENLFIAAYRGPVAFADAVMDEVAFFDVQLTGDQIQDLALATSIVRPLPVAALPSAPAANAYWVDPIDGNDSASAAQARSATSLPPANPWRSLAKAIAEWNAGNLAASGSGHVEIILRGGLSYERGKNLTITRSGSSSSHLVIKGYRDDIQTGTRGGTGKFTGAKGWFVLRGNIAALEAGGWELWNAGRSIYRTTSTQSITGSARACWLGATTHNLQLVPARSRSDLDTDNEVGVTTNPIYSAPGLVQHTDNNIYVRMKPNQWTNFFGGYFADSYYPGGTVPTWGTNPASEPLAVFDDTAGFTISGAAQIDLEFWRADYWARGLRLLGNCNNLIINYWHTIGTVYCINTGDAGTVHNLTFTHCDFIQNIAPWHGWQWIKENGQGIQGKLQGRTIDLTAVYPHHITIRHCRLVRGFDGGGVDNGNTDTAPHDIVFENNHLFWMRDDSFAYSSSVYNSRFLYNYHELCWQGYGRVGRPSTGNHVNQAPGTLHIGFNILDLRRPHFRGRPGDPSGEYNTNGASALAENFGLQWGRVDPGHSIDNDEVSENKYYHNVILCGRDESNVGVWSWKDGIKSTAVQEERYNNIVINVEDAEYHGRGQTRYIEQDYNCYWGDPAGSFAQNKVLVNTAGGSSPSFATWAAFRASGATYNETKHANGDGPGSPQGWEFHGIEADPEFVDGRWETIVVGNLATYFPAANGNCGFAVGLSATGWPGTSPQQGYVGAYAPGHVVTKIGPEQGLWVD